MGAWWPPRSSKPLRLGDPGSGWFDSFPLRFLYLWGMCLPVDVRSCGRQLEVVHRIPPKGVPRTPEFRVGYGSRSPRFGRETSLSLSALSAPSQP